MTKPLHDVKVVQFASEACPFAVALALALAGRLAQDLGAQVELLDGAARNPLRDINPLIDGQSALSLFLDADKTESAGDALSDADVVLSDLAPPAQLGDRQIWTRVSMRADKSRGEDSEFTLMAATGLLDLVGDPDDRPLRLGGHQLAYAAGLAAYAGFTAALCARKEGRATGPVSVNLADVGVWLNWKSVAAPSWNGRAPTRLGEDAEWRPVRCADGWTALVYLEADWPVLRDLVDDPRLADPRFDDRSVRRANAALISGVIEEFFADMTRNELRELALKKRIPLGPVWSPRELEVDPQYVARDFLSRAADGVLRPKAPVMWNGQRFDRAAAL